MILYKEGEKMNTLLYSIEIIASKLRTRLWCSKNIIFSSIACEINVINLSILAAIMFILIRRLIRRKVSFFLQ